MHFQLSRLHRNWPILSRFYHKYSLPATQLGFFSNFGHFPSLHTVKFNNSSSKQAGIAFDRNLCASFIEFWLVSEWSSSTPAQFVLNILSKHLIRAWFLRESDNRLSKSSIEEITKTGGLKFWKNLAIEMAESWHFVVMLLSQRSAQKTRPLIACMPWCLLKSQKWKCVYLIHLRPIQDLKSQLMTPNIDSVCCSLIGSLHL